MGSIGPARVNFFVPVQGSGWVREGDQRADVEVGEVVYTCLVSFTPKGSDDGLVALIVQVHDLDLGGEGKTSSSHQGTES